MKLSDLTPKQKTRLLAELDGWTGVQYNPKDGIIGIYPNSKTQRYEICPRYLNSYDAIIPLVQKLFSVKNFRSFDYALTRVCIGNISTPMASYNTLTATPSQLCDAVLVATGKVEI